MNNRSNTFKVQIILTVLSKKIEAYRKYRNPFSIPIVRLCLIIFFSAGARGNDMSGPTESTSSKITELYKDVIIIDDQQYYCMLCLSKVQKEKSSKIGDIKSYSRTSSTDPLRNHLIMTHKIPCTVSV
jgi:hypothetical protein